MYDLRRILVVIASTLIAHYFCDEYVLVTVLWLAIELESRCVLEDVICSVNIITFLLKKPINITNNIGIEIALT